MVMPQTLKKLRGHIDLGLSICPAVHLSVTLFICFKASEPLELGELKIRIIGFVVLKKLLIHFEMLIEPHFTLDTCSVLLCE